MPFYNQIALGYRGDLVRGYDPYVINGENFALFKSLVKYAIIQPKSFNIPVGLPQSFTRIPYALYANLFLMQGMFATNASIKTTHYQTNGSTAMVQDLTL